MLPFEAVVIVYLAFFAGVAPFSRVAAPRRLATVLAAGILAAAVYLAAWTLPIWLRLWLPFLYIAIGYWLPSALVPPFTGGAFENWLRRTDAVVRRSAGRLPQWFAAALQFAYFACLPMVPIAFAAVWVAGSPDDVARYWRGVLIAGYACYATLPWLISRPPRFFDDGAPGVVPVAGARFNRRVLGVVSHGLNTFPSGHVAVAVAAAIGAGVVWPAAGVALGVVAAAVALGAFVGGYHYFADVVIGVAVGAAAAWF